MVARATSQHEAAIALERRFGARHLPALDPRSVETHARDLACSRGARAQFTQHIRKPRRDRMKNQLRVLLRVHAHRHLRTPRVRVRRVAVPKTRAAHRTNSCFLELHWKTPSSLCEDSLRYKLELRHILNGSTDWSELHRTACSHSHDDSYMYGSRLELPRVLNAAA